MQANTAGDQYSWALVESDGTTPLPVTGVTTVAVAIAGPYSTQEEALAAVFTSGVTTAATLGTSPPTASWVTTISGHGNAQATTYPEGGWYCHQVILTYAGGAIAKGQLFALQLMDSIA